MTTSQLLRDLVSRVVSAQEALEDGDAGYAHAILTGLEADLVSSLAALELEAAA